MGAPAIPRIRLGLTATGLAAERLDAVVHHRRTTRTTVFRAVRHGAESAVRTCAVQPGGLPDRRTTSSPPFAA
ncbi:hypothetical protein [Lentzea sp. NEAU-D7]|uniref:hypothetical protein n=1 Tax=Lentzea sp. NEAU-D7 TaxID=2994667 RepID=UPI00224B8958|nr:hypothetical protein [Lentzea sp. NEAU-D7]MCX2946827.1 hypothetical protein [Lentzea sp. NEAU-D7]